MMSGVSRVSIPYSVKKTIRNIKEIVSNHSDEEIYTMLRECSMDPNETAQKLLYQDTFHEVKSKREKRRVRHREAADCKWIPVSDSRGIRDGPGNYTSRYSFRGSGAGRYLGSFKENGINHVRGKIISSSSRTPLGAKVTNEENRPTAYVSSLSNGSIKAEHLSAADDPSFRGSISAEESSVFAINKRKISSVHGKSFISSTSQHSLPTSEVYASASDPVLVQSLGGHTPAALSTNKNEIGIHTCTAETYTDKVIAQDACPPALSLSNGSGSCENNHLFLRNKITGNSLALVGVQAHDAVQPAPPTLITASSGSRPSSNYSNRSQHARGSLKAAPTKEWRPKSTNVIPAPSSMVISLSGGKGQEPSCCSSPASDSMVPNNIAKLRKLEDLHISDTQHVIIPDHLQVPESEKTGLTFGSFASNFGLIMSSRTEPENEVVLEELSESSSELEENADNLPSNSSPDIENSNYYANEQSEMPENHSTAVSCSPDLSQTADYGQLKAEVSLPPGGFQPTISGTTPVYSNLGMVPQMLGSHFSTFEGEGLHAHDNAHLPSVAVPQTFDHSANYYASIYRLADGDDRVSPFPSIAPKYSGNIADFPAQIALSPQKSDNSLLLSSTGVAPLVTQTAGVRQTSVAASQQQIHVHRQPAGIPLSHYPPNCVSYAQYFSPFYVPSSAMHHFFGNTAIFPQQPPTRSLYPPPAAVGVNPVKYPISQYKPASNSNPTGQGTYVLNHSGYGSIMSGNSTVSGDLMSSQFKEKQSEGSAVWITPLVRDISTLQGSSFYNIPPQGQPIAFAPTPTPTPTQAGHSGAFAGLYHPSRSVTAASVHPLLQQSQAMARPSEVLGPPVGIYQQTQHTPQINWVSNF